MWEYICEYINFKNFKIIKTEIDRFIIINKYFPLFYVVNLVSKNYFIFYIGVKKGFPSIKKIIVLCEYINNI